MDQNVNVDFVNFGELGKLLVMPFKKYSVIEVNSLNMMVVLFFFFTFQISRCSFVDHNSSRHLKGLKRLLVNWVLKRSLGVLIVNERLKLNYSESVNIELISPFLPPELAEEGSILSSYPFTVTGLMRDRKFFINSAWKYIPYEQNDLYGIQDSLLLLDTFQDAVMILAIADYNFYDMPQKVQSLIEKHQESGQLHLLTGQKELWPLFKAAELSLRLTPTDGDSVSVKEALYFNCSVLASDAVVRPKGCLVYQYGNFEDLKAKFKALYY